MRKTSDGRTTGFGGLQIVAPGEHVTIAVRRPGWFGRLHVVRPRYTMSRVWDMTMRGGGWFYSHKFCRSATRLADLSETEGRLGLRCVVTYGGSAR